MFAGFLAGLFAFTIVEWVAVAAFVVFLVMSVATYSHEQYGPSFFTMVVSLAGLGFLFKTDLLTYVQNSNIVLAIAKPLIAYVVIGFVVSFVNWVFFCMRAKERYRSQVLEVIQSTTYYNNALAAIKKGFGTVDYDLDATLTKPLIQKIIQAYAATNYNSDIFGSSYSAPDKFYYNRLDGMTLEVADAYATETLASALPPKATRGKAILASAVFEWPITILSLVFSRILTVLVDKIIYASRKLFDAVSKLSFGSTDITV